MSKGMVDYLTSVNPDIVELNGGTRTRRLATRTATERDSSSLFNSDEKYVPRYLKPPTGSCHDYCKYGRKHDPEAECKHPSLHIFYKKVHPEDPLQVDGWNVEERGKRLTSGKESSFQDKPNVIAQKVLRQFKKSSLNKQYVRLNLQTQSSSHKSIAADEKGIISVAMENDQAQVVVSKCDRNMKQGKEPKTSLLQKASANKKLVNSKTKPIEHQRFKQRALVPSSKFDTLAKPVMPLDTSKTPTMTGSPWMMLGSNGHRIEEYKMRNSCNTKKMVEKKTLKSQMPTQSCKGNDISSLNLKKHRHGKSLNTMNNQEVRMEKTINVTEPKTMKFGSKYLLRRLPNQENVDFVSVTEESWESDTFHLDSRQHEPPESKYVNLPDTKNLEFVPIAKASQELQIAKLDSPLREFPESESVDLFFLEQSSLKSEILELNCLEKKSKDDWSSQSSVTYDANKETEESNCVLTESSELECENKVSQISNDCKSLRFKKNNPVIHPEDNLSAPSKSRFRRGKTITNEPESNGLVRLRFQRTIAGDATDKEDQVVNNCSLGAPLAVASPSHRVPEAPTLVLRPQERQEKKDLQGLFNIVIEETANKLVQCRKSKVQALVGAFETVILLQDK